MISESATLTALDGAFVCLERPDAPLHLGAVAVFDPPAARDPDHLLAVLAERAQATTRLCLRTRIRSVPPGLCWQPHPHFRAREHIHAHHVPAPGSFSDLADVVSELFSAPLDLTRPPWEIHVITGLAEQRFAVLLKIHHALADGASAVQLGRNLLDNSEPPASTPSPPHTRAGFAPTAMSLIRPDYLLGTATALLHDTTHTLEITASAAAHLRVPPPHTPLAATTSPTKHVAFHRIDMSEIRSIRARQGGTTHDVVLAIVTGALRRWITARGHDQLRSPIRALIPVDERRRTRNEGGNQLSGYLCDLPLCEPDPLRRLHNLQHAMHTHKTQGPTRGPGAIARLAAHIPTALHQLATPLLGRQARILFDLLITTVPLPTQPPTLTQAPLHALFPLSPLPAGHAIAIAACPGRQTLHLGLTLNHPHLPQTTALTTELPHAVTELTNAS